MQGVTEGWKQKDFAAFLGVSIRDVGGWVVAHRKASEDGKATPHPGPTRKLTCRREHSVLSGLARCPQALSFKTDLWTTRRYGVHFYANYLANWLPRRGYSPQKPEVRAVERDEPTIARWAAEDWSRIKKDRKTKPTSS